MNILKNIEFLISGIDFDNQSIYQQKEFIIKNLSSKLNHYIVNNNLNDNKPDEQNKINFEIKNTTLKISTNENSYAVTIPFIPSDSKNNTSIPKVPGVPSIPGVPGVPSVPKVPGVPSIPGVPGVPSVPKVPGVPSIPGVPGVPSIPKVPGVPSIPGVPGVPSIPGVPGVPSVTKVPGVPSIPGVPGVPSIPGVPGVPSIPGVPKLSGPPVPGVPGIRPLVPGIPGAPGFLGMSQRPGISNPVVLKKENKPPKDLVPKYYFWTQVNKNKLKDTFWSKLDLNLINVECDYDNLCKFFCEPKKVEKKEDKKEDKKIGDPVVTKILDDKRLMNLAIGLSKVQIPNVQLAEYINEMKYSKLDVDLIDKIIALAPNQEETEKLINFNGDIKSISSSERFCMTLITVPKYKNKLESMRYKLILTPDVLECKKKFDLLIETAITIRVLFNSS